MIRTGENVLIKGDKKMLCKEVYSALTSLNESLTLETQVEEFLQSKGLIDVMQPADYDVHNKNSKRISSVKSEINTAKHNIEELEEGIDSAKTRLSSWGYRAKTFLGFGEPELDKRELQGHIDKLKSTKANLAEQEECLKVYESSEKDIANRVKTKKGNYARVSDKGEHIKEDLRARIYREANSEFEQFESELENVLGRLEEGFSSWRSTYDILIKDYGQDEDTRSLAIEISKKGGEAAIPKFKELYAALRKNVYDSSDMRPLAAMLCGSAKSPDELAAILKQTYEKIHDESRDNGKQRLAAAILMSPSAEELDKRIENYKTVYGIFFETLNISKDSDYLPALASLAMLPGDCKEHIDRVKQIYDSLSKDFSTGDRLRISSVILASMRTDNEKAMDEFKRAYNEISKLAKKRGSNADSSDYITSAIMAIMPGDPEEAVNILNKAVSHLETKEWGSGLNERVGISARFLDGVYAYLGEHSESFKSSVDYWHSSSSYHHSNYNNSWLAGGSMTSLNAMNLLTSPAFMMVPGNIFHSMMSSSSMMHSSMGHSSFGSHSGFGGHGGFGHH